MKPFIALIAFIMLAVSARPEAAPACTFPPPPEFAKIAPTAARIFVFRVMGLKVREQSLQMDDGGENTYIGVDADILVQKTLAGDTANITLLRFHNGACGGVNLIIGHHYLMATNQLDATIDLAPGDRSLGDIEQQYDPDSAGSKNLETNKYVIAAAAAMDGKQSFDSVLDDDAYKGLATVPPPPQVKIVTEPCKPKPKPGKKAVTKKTARK